MSAILAADVLATVKFVVRRLRARLEVEAGFAAHSVARAQAVRREQDHAPEPRRTKGTR
jgi:hypothetical protein